MVLSTLGLALGFLQLAAGEVERLYNAANYPNLPEYGPLPNVAYMVDNQHNYFKTAPDKGTHNGPAYVHSGSFENFMVSLEDGSLSSLSSSLSSLNGSTDSLDEGSMSIMASSGYWLPQLAPLGKQPIAGGDYKFYRNVVDYGADNSGGSDASEAINAAVQDGKRCGMECGNTFAQGAIVYFPPGTYKICSPVVQLYYTQFIGDALNPPTIKGCDEFVGIALFDTDPYIPGGHGQNWYINQNQFFRQIRNFVFDLTEMPLKTDEHDQPLVPTGIHWQVSQACSLQNLVFNMPQATSGGAKVTHVGIFMENGSGGFVSDLTFNGGNIGWRAGSQQYTAMNLQFKGCLTAVQMVWDWGFNWQRVTVEGSAIAFNISGQGGDTGQGIGSVSIIDSKISNTPIAILTRSKSSGVNGTPNIVLDNLELSGVEAAVKDEEGNVILGAAGKIDLWASGRRYDGYNGVSTTGAVTAPKRSSTLLDDSGKLFYRPRPQYELFTVDQFMIATDNGCSNDGTGDNTVAVNNFLQAAKNAGKIAYFPAGIYRVGGTVTIPTGSRVQGSSWSQIQGAGMYFSNIRKPQVVVKVGNRGDVGTMEIVDMMFNVQGATAGAIVLEWNVHESSQGSAAMWDSHVRVGGATGTDLDINSCPKFSFSENCICASMLFHVTAQASGYFENVWIWLADHDNDMSVYSSPDKIANQISLYAARGTLIESKGPSWFYGTGSEHTIMYQYQLYGAKDIYLGHIQTETPYYQPVPFSPNPFESAKAFPGDPSFDDCNGDGSCAAAWGLRIINSEGITIHSAGLYSFFQEYYQDCIEPRECQKSVVEVKGSKDVIIFNTFTIGVTEIANGIDGGSIGFEGNINGYTTEISVWVPLPGDDEQNVVYVGPEIFDKPQLQCPPPCVLVFPTSSLAQPTTIQPGDYTTSLEYGAPGTTSINGQVVTTFFTTTTTITVKLPPITTDGIPFYNVNITRGQTSSNIVMSTSIDLPTIPVVIPGPSGSSTTRYITVPPWPGLLNGPPDGSGTGSSPSEPDQPGSDVFRTPFVTTISATAATVTTIQLPSTISPIAYTCPPDTTIVFNTPRTTLTTECDDAETKTLGFTCPPTRVVTFLGPSTGVFTVDCTLATSFAEDTAGPVPTDDTDPIWTPKPKPSSTPTTTTTPTLPIWSTWPGELFPVETDVPEDNDDDDDDNGIILTPCHFWFFSFCPKSGIRIGGWRWPFPPGIYGPKPPRIHWPPEWTLKIPEIPGPWPLITIGFDNKVTYGPEPTESCTTQKAELCSTTSVITRTTTAKTTITTGISVSSRCETVTGCTVSDADATKTSTTDLSCPTKRAVARQWEQTGTAIASDEAKVTHGHGPLMPRQAPSCGALAVVFPKDGKNVGEIPTLLQAYAGKYEKAESKRFGITSFFQIPDLDPATLKKLTESKDVEFAYYVDDWAEKTGVELDDTIEEEAAVKMDTLVSHSEQDKSAEHMGLVHSLSHNETDAAELAPSSLMKRTVGGRDARWEMSQISHPRGQFIWGTPGRAGGNSYKDGKWRFAYDDSIGGDQYVYVMGEATENTWYEHNEIPENQLTYFPDWIKSQKADKDDDDPMHGTFSIAKVFGKTLGTCAKCNVVYCPAVYPKGTKKGARGDYLTGLWAVTELLDFIPDSQKGKVTLSFSISFSNKVPQATWSKFRDALQALEDQHQAVIVIAAGNHAIKTSRGPAEGLAISRYPAKLGETDNGIAALDNLIVVSNTDKDGTRWEEAQYSPYVTTFAPGRLVGGPGNPAVNPNGYMRATGTSISTPTVAGVVAYLRGLDSPYKDELKNPAAVKKLIKLLHRRIPIDSKQQGPNYSADRIRPVVWNGQVGKVNCLTDYDLIEENFPATCPKLEKTILGTQGDGETTDTCPVPGQPGPVPRDVSGGSCPLLPSGGSGSGSGSGSGNNGSGRTVTYTSGPTPTPTCQNPAGCGGRLCTGYYCSPKPTGVPPDFHDPMDPSGGQLVPTTSIAGPGGPSGVPPIVSSALPTLPPVSTGGDFPSNCASTTTWSSCALGVPPGVSACQTFSSCAATVGPIDPSALPTLTGVVTDAPIPTNCAATTTWENCALGVPPGASACVTHSSCISTSTTAQATTATPDPIPTGPATFYLYLYNDGGDINGHVEFWTSAVSRKAKGFSENPSKPWPTAHCDAIYQGTPLFYDNGDPLDPQYSWYPWYVKSFGTKGRGGKQLCGKDLKFKLRGKDYDVFEGDKQVGFCGPPTGGTVSCLSPLTYTYYQIYACTGAC